MNYNEADAYLKKLSGLGSKPGTERVISLLEALGHPERSLKCIHVAGTNGKGSVSAMLSSVLGCAGYSVGMYTTPYLEKINECYRLNENEIGDDEFAALISEIAPFANAAGATEYEVMTVLAFVYFSQHTTDICIIECCMGGLLDATNVIEKPLLSIITGISVDHTLMLGKTVAQIAGHKAGIIKSGCPAVVGKADPEALGVIIKKAGEMHSRCTLVDYSAFDVKLSENGTFFRTLEYESGIALGLIGSFQVNNALTAISCVKVLNEIGLKINDRKLLEGLYKTRWNGRFEYLSKKPDVIFDGSHNADGVRYAVETVKSIYGKNKIILITGVMRDKEYVKMSAQLAPLADTVFSLRPDNKRALDPYLLADVYQKLGVPAYPCDDEKTAFEKALSVSRGRPVIILGSLYSYRKIKETVKNILKSEG